MAIQFLSSSAVAQNNATNVSTTIPGTVNTGELMLAFVTHRYSLTTPTGWTLVATQSATHLGLHPRPVIHSVFSRTVQTGDASSGVTWTCSGSDRLGAQIHVFKDTAGELTVSSSATAASNNRSDGDAGNPIALADIASISADDGTAVVAGIGSLGLDTGDPNNFTTAPSGFTLLSASDMTTLVNYRTGVAWKTVSSTGTVSGTMVFGDMNGSSSQTAYAAVSVVLAGTPSPTIGAISNLIIIPIGADLQVDFDYSNPEPSSLYEFTVYVGTDLVIDYDPESLFDGYKTHYSFTITNSHTGNVYVNVQGWNVDGTEATNALEEYLYISPPGAPVVVPIYYGRPELFRLRYYDRTDLLNPVLSLPIAWYAQGKIRVVPLRLSIDATQYVVTEAATDVEEEILLSSTAGLIATDKLKFHTGEIAEILEVTDNSVFLSRGVNGIFAPLLVGSTATISGASYRDIRLFLTEDDDALSAAILENQWLSIKLSEDESYTPLGEFLIGEVAVGSYVDLDLRLYIPPYSLDGDFCATERITYPTGESFITLNTEWYDPNSPGGLFGDSMYGSGVYGDSTQKTPPGGYHSPLLQVNYYDADEVAFLEANGVEFPGDTE